MKDPQIRRIIKSAVISLAGVAVLLVVFASGVALGSRKARFSEAYWRPAHGDRGFGSGIPELPGGHGASGRVVSVSGNSFVIAAPDESEKVVIVNASTTIRRFRSSASTSDVRVGDSVIVLGDPNDAGQVDAALVRIIPNVPSGR